MPELGDSQVLYACQNCKTPVGSSFDIYSKKFHGSYGAAYLFNTVQNLDSGEERVTQMTTGQHSIRSQNCSTCGKELGWLYVAAIPPSQQYKVGKTVLERNLLCTQFSSPETPVESKLKAKPKEQLLSSVAPSATKPSALTLYQDRFLLSSGVVILAPSSNLSFDEFRVYMPDKVTLLSCSKQTGESLEDSALRCATAIQKNAAFLPSPDGREPFAVTFDNLTTTERVQTTHWFLFSARVPPSEQSECDWPLAPAAIATLSPNKADLIVNAVEMFRQRKAAAANGEEAVFVDGSWDLVDEEPGLSDATSGLQLA